MLDAIKRLLTKNRENANSGKHIDTAEDLRMAACALLVEIARIDNEFTSAEMEKIVSLLINMYDITQADADDLIAAAEKELEDSIDLWQFARLINENYSNEEKINIVEMLWRVVYVDGKMDEHEHYMMNKLKNLLRLDHRHLIDAKLRVKNAGKP